MSQSSASETTAGPCPHMRSCRLFPILSASNALDYWVGVYCKGEFTKCARHDRLTRGLTVAPNLLPNGKKI
ncbi:hypothetical protein [Plesiocystis pacifica]|nr:hypothetical protein [Plesiocystis pacifica]